jgi:8-oxo-dGTP pyrophosphatase MutT (NUDIX family)
MKKTVQVVLINEHNQALCVSRKDNHSDFGLPGGKMDPCDLTELDAIVRETKEETGLDITNMQLIYATHKDGSMGYTYIAKYSGEINYTEPHIVKWGTFDDLIKGTFGKWNYCVWLSLKDMGIILPLDMNIEGNL